MTPELLLLPNPVLLYLPFVLPVCIWAAWSDVARMKIPNMAVLALVLVFLVVGPLVHSAGEYAHRWLHLLVVLGIGFGLTMAGFIGAGDAKFMAALAPFVSRSDASLFLMMTALVLSVAFIVHRALKGCHWARQRTPDWQSWEREDFPMGLALGGVLPIYLGLLTL